MVKRNYIAFLVPLFLTLACQKNNPKVTGIIALSAFDEVHLETPFEVELVEDTIFYIEVIGHAKTIDDLAYTVENKVLRLANRLKAKYMKPKTNALRLIIHAQPLRIVEANETCSITTRNPITSADFGLILKSKGNFADLELNGSVFYYWNNYPCGGKLTLRGQTDQLKIWNTAIFSVDAKNLTTDYCLVENSSKGACELRVTGSIEYKIKGEGNIEVYGSPSLVVEREKTGTGKFILK